MPALQLSRKNRATGALGAIAAELALAAMIFWGLTVQFARAPDRPPGLVTITVSPEPSPMATPSDAREGEAAPPGREAEPAPKEAPPAKIQLPPPEPAAPVTGEGEARTAGAALSGTGTGAGGAGSGTGAGGSGTGTGAGKATPPVRIAGALHDRDYPREAERVQAEGTVGISFRVRTNGRVDRCTVLQSSGYAILDSRTCQLFERRFRFRPALNAAGQPVEATLRTSFTWGLHQRR